MNNYRLTPLQYTERNRARIMKGVLLVIDEPVIPKRKVWRPILVTITLLIIVVSVSVSNLKQAYPNGDLNVQKITIPGVEYAGLVMSEYLEDTNEIIYADPNSIYAYDVKAKKKETLIQVEDASIYKHVVNEKWIVWLQFSTSDDTTASYVKNRKTGEVKQLQLDLTNEVYIDGDMVIAQTYLHREQDFYDLAYVNYNLFNDEWTPIHIFNDGIEGKGMYADNTLIIAEELKVHTSFYVYDTKTFENTSNYGYRITDIQHMQIQNNELFMLYKQYDEMKIGAIDLKEQKFEEFTIDGDVTDFATNGDMFAVSISEEHEEDVIMFERQDTQLNPYSILPKLDEKVVAPRLKGDTFIVNGESKDSPIYFIQLP